MPNIILQEIDSLHSEWSRMDKTTRLGWLMGVKMQLNRLANQFARTIQIKGGFSNDEERVYAHKLNEMIQEVNVAGGKAVNDIASDVFKEVIKGMFR